MCVHCLKEDLLLLIEGYSTNPDDTAFHDKLSELADAIINRIGEEEGKDE